MPTSCLPRLHAPRFRGARLPRLRAQVEAVTLARLVSAATAGFPLSHVAVGEHLRRTAAAVPVNVADACLCPARADRARHLAAAGEALVVLESHLALAADAALIPEHRARDLARHCRWTGRLLHALAHAPMR